MHRMCAGLSKIAFNAANESDDQFFYHYCSSKCIRDEINALKERISSLKASLRQQSTTTTTGPSENYSSVVQSKSTCKISCNYQSDKEKTAPTNNTFEVSSPATQHHSRSGRKYNLVIYGIKKNRRGTPTHTLSENDINSVTSILSSVCSSVSEFSV